MSEGLRCPYCRKLVRNGRFIGTLHFCLSVEDRAKIDRVWQANELQIEAQKRVIRSVNPYTNGLGSLFK